MIYGESSNYMKNKNRILHNWKWFLKDQSQNYILHLNCLSRMLVLMTAGVFGWMNSQSWLENINLTQFLCFTINLGIFWRSPWWWWCRRRCCFQESSGWRRALAARDWSRYLSEISHLLNNFKSRNWVFLQSWWTDNFWLFKISWQNLFVFHAGNN